MTSCLPPSLCYEKEAENWRDTKNRHNSAPWSILFLSQSSPTNSVPRSKVETRQNSSNIEQVDWRYWPESDLSYNYVI